MRWYMRPDVCQNKAICLLKDDFTYISLSWSSSYIFQTILENYFKLHWPKSKLKLLLRSVITFYCWIEPITYLTLPCFFNTFLSISCSICFWILWGSMLQHLSQDFILSKGFYWIKLDSLFLDLLYPLCSSWEFVLLYTEGISSKRLSIICEY